MMKLLVPAALVALQVVSLAGSGGIAPPNGTYTFHRTNPAPAEDVATGRFGDPNCTVNPAGGGASSTWTRGADGQYRPPPPTNRSFCVHPGGVLTYEYKFFGDVVSSGTLVP
jgi:hypothetical protein